MRSRDAALILLITETHNDFVRFHGACLSPPTAVVYSER